jgi:folylpolyglutamate synthase/dihydropteroate synthase
MNPYAILGAVLLWGASIGGAFFYGQGIGKDAQIANESAVKDAIAETRKAALEGAADAIAKIKVRSTTIQGKVETIVRDNPVYRDCAHGPDGLRNINEALSGRPGRPGDSVVSGADAAK